jgi:16S rRNA (cytosine967-C5)-methyltransferase
VRGVRVERLPGFEEGGFVVQDAAQVLGLAHAEIADGALVWDACAAPGGKTASLARRCRVIASDVRRERLARLRGTLRRVAADARVLYADATRPPFGPDRFDAVLLDVPCTATGALAKHPDARWHLSPSRLERLLALQAALLDGVAPTVRPGGLLVYMTCSLEPEENALQMERFLAGHPAFRRDRDDLELFPPDRGTDGGYTARLVRVA